MLCVAIEQEKVRTILDCMNGRDTEEKIEALQLRFIWLRIGRNGLPYSEVWYALS